MSARLLLKNIFQWSKQNHFAYYSESSNHKSLCKRNELTQFFAARPLAKTSVHFLDDSNSWLPSFQNIFNLFLIFCWYRNLLIVILALYYFLRPILHFGYLVQLKPEKLHAWISVLMSELAIKQLSRQHNTYLGYKRSEIRSLQATMRLETVAHSQGENLRFSIRPHSNSFKFVNIHYALLVNLKSSFLSSIVIIENNCVSLVSRYFSKYRTTAVYWCQSFTDLSIIET